MAINYETTKNTNTRFGGTEGIILPKGTDAQRPGAPAAGDIRYSETSGILEQYTGTQWQSIGVPPVVVNQQGTLRESTDTTITIAGSYFVSGAVVYVTGAGVGGSERALTTTFVSENELTANTNAAAVNFTGGSDYGIKVTNPGGLSGEITQAGVVDTPPLWVTASGTIATVFDLGRDGFAVTVSATDPEGEEVIYSQTSGSLPPNTFLNARTGKIQGKPQEVSTDTTYSFTLRATAGSTSSDRNFNIVVKAPVTQTFNYTGGVQSFTYPANVTRVEAKLWGAGGSAQYGTVNQYFGGAGGFTKGVIDASVGDILYLRVGGGGSSANPGGGGGGSSAIHSTNSYSQSTALLVAGGGGASHGGPGENGGAGGGAIAQGARDEGAGGPGVAPNAEGTGGGGATQTQGGIAGNNSAATTDATDGSAFQGGRGTGNAGTSTGGWPDGGDGSSAGGSNGGGGGGGYYGGGGGGGGSPNNGAGGGGSGFVFVGTRGNFNVLSGETFTGDAGTPPTAGTDDSDYPGGGIAEGGFDTGSYDAGSNGAIVIRY
jgi:hypothetical protein